MIEITMTDRARTELLKVLRLAASSSIRLIRQGFGWVGPRLGMVLDEPGTEDQTVHLRGIDFIYNKDDTALLDQTFIDYRDSWYGIGFVIYSPASEPCEPYP